MSAAPQLKGQNPLLDKNLINAFLTSVQKTMKNMANTDVQAQKAYVRKDDGPHGEISGFIGMMSGGMRGTLSLTFEKPAIFLIVQNMLGETHSELGQDVADAVGELTNMIYGDAKTTLNQQGFSFQAAIPQVVVGRHKLVSTHSGATLVVPFQCSSGAFFIELTLEE